MSEFFGFLLLAVTVLFAVYGLKTAVSPDEFRAACREAYTKELVLEACAKYEPTTAQLICRQARRSGARLEACTPKEEKK